MLDLKRLKRAEKMAEQATEFLVERRERGKIGWGEGGLQALLVFPSARRREGPGALTIVAVEIVALPLPLPFVAAPQVCWVVQGELSASTWNVQSSLGGLDSPFH